MTKTNEKQVDADRRIRDYMSTSYALATLDVVDVIGNGVHSNVFLCRLPGPYGLHVAVKMVQVVTTDQHLAEIQSTNEPPEEEEKQEDSEEKKKDNDDDKKNEWSETAEIAALLDGSDTTLRCRVPRFYGEHKTRCSAYLMHSCPRQDFAGYARRLKTRYPSLHSPDDTVWLEPVCGSDKCHLTKIRHDCTTMAQKTVRAIDVVCTVMEYIPQTYAEYISTLSSEAERDNAHTRLLVTMADFLAPAQEKYEFEHGDLHADNIMVHKNGGFVALDLEYARLVQRYGNNKKKILVGTGLLDLTEEERKLFVLPLKPYVDALRPWYDLAFLIHHLLVLNNPIIKPSETWVARFKRFLDRHGVLFNKENRPVCVHTKFGPRDLLEYIRSF